MTVSKSKKEIHEEETAMMEQLKSIGIRRHSCEKFLLEAHNLVGHIGEGDLDKIRAGITSMEKSLKKLSKITENFKKRSFYINEIGKVHFDRDWKTKDFMPLIRLEGDYPQVLFLGRYPKKKKPKLKEGSIVRVIIYSE